MPIPDAALSELRDILGDRLSVSAADREQHAGSETFHRAPPPDAVAWPLTTDEVSQVLRICNDARVPVIGWGTGTSLEGHALAVTGGITLDMGRMNRVLEIRAEDMQVSIQPGLPHRLSPENR